MQARRVTVATFNVHAGVDGWGRPFDALDACVKLDADVLVLQEDWAPSGGPSIGERVAERLRCNLSTVTLAHGWMHPVPSDAGSGFGPGSLSRRQVGLRLDSSLASRRRRREPRSRLATPLSMSTRGEWRLSVLSRIPVLKERTVELERLR